MKHHLDPDTRGTTLLVWSMLLMLAAALLLAWSLAGRAFG